MRLATVAGPPSSGKTSVILRAAEGLRNAGYHLGVVKFDCLSSEDEKRYQQAGIPVKTGLAGACARIISSSPISTPASSGGAGRVWTS
ncbi:hypothetical protein [Desulfosarcina cetonica]|uniref:hypothetical protein n=1 Tax=Desulfosarcina cetonica TaxID=90730 RepID=UPI000AAE6B58|nr:hypothetical protein [Desulfosarcina cetonica]